MFVILINNGRGSVSSGLIRCAENMVWLSPNSPKSAINPENGDKYGEKVAINAENGDKSGDKKSTKFKKKIFEYFAEHKKLVPKD